MRIITIGREFGSGGRELGKRLAEKLGYAYYDVEILKAIAEKSGLAESYVQNIVEKSSMWYFPITYARSFNYTNVIDENYWKIVRAQSNVLTELAQKSDCVFVGRCADVILQDFHPMNIFVYADMEAKIRRCREKAPEGENLSDAELKKKIKEIENKRKQYYKTFTDNKWGEKENYHLCINTSGKQIKHFIPSIADYCLKWFEENENNPGIDEK